MKLMISKIFYALVVLTFTHQSSTYAQDNQTTFNKIQDTFAQGFYQEVVQESESLEVASFPQTSTTDKSKIFFLKGVSLNKLQRYDQALEAFKASLKFGFKDPEIYFEIGQAFYALQKFDDAIKSFAKSRRLNFKVATSTYFIAYCHQILEHYDEALKNYKAIQTPEDLRLAAHLQMADIALIQAEKIEDPNLRKEKIKLNILPTYDKLAEAAVGTTVGSQAGLRKMQITAKHFPPRRKGDKPWSLGLSEVFKYDTNVITQADQVLVRVNEKESGVVDTIVKGKYEFKLDDWSLTPGADLDYTYYTHHGVPEIHTNDALQTTANLALAYQHHLFGYDAKVTLEYLYTYMLRDWAVQHRLLFFNTTHNIFLGELFQLFDFGPTILKFGYKNLSSFDRSYNANAFLSSLTQIAMLTKNLSYVFVYSGELQNTYDRTKALNIYRFINLLTIHDIGAKIQLQFNMNVTLTDTKDLYALRGLERLFNPGFEFSRELFDYFKITLGYNFSRQLSTDTFSYQYEKHVAHLGLSVGIP